MQNPTGSRHFWTKRSGSHEGAAPEMPAQAFDASPRAGSDPDPGPQVASQLSGSVKVYVGIVLAAGGLTVAASANAGSTLDLSLVGYLVLAVLASTAKIRLPGITGTMSLAFLAVLATLVAQSLPATLLVAAIAIVIQCYWKPAHKPSHLQVLFNLASMMISTAAAFRIFHVSPESALVYRICAAASVHFAINTALVSGVIALTEKKPLFEVWKANFLWTFPHYLAGATIVALFGAAHSVGGWPSAFLIVPLVLYWINRHFKLYVARIRDARHVEEIDRLLLRTVEAFALAAGARNHSAHVHLHRVNYFAMEIGRKMNLTPLQLKGLHAASLLHEIGTLAVPEHILTKPGAVSNAEFERIKVHPSVGAEIVERIQFPYPVAPIVRGFREKWEGNGYPDGLAKEAIPLEARILSVADCFAALTEDRPYRTALSTKEAVGLLILESGRSFDPDVVNCFVSLYAVLEAGAERHIRSLFGHILDRRVETPSCSTVPLINHRRSSDSLELIAEAHHEARELYQLGRNLGSSLSFAETMPKLTEHIRHLCRFDGLALLVQRQDILEPAYAVGLDDGPLQAASIPVGIGLSGQVAASNQPVLNGRPEDDVALLGMSKDLSQLSAALSVPLAGVEGPAGVLTLYHRREYAFNEDQLRIIIALSDKLGPWIENVVRYEAAEVHANTDGLTGLPNARSLFREIERQISRARREEQELVVMVCDLDGFKQVNDRFGHLVGNAVLRTVATDLRSTCREYDYVARLGGDEFIALLPGYDSAMLEARRDEFRKIAERAGYLHCQEGILSMSVGIAKFPGSGLTAETLLDSADRDMYRAKAERKSAVRRAQSVGGNAVTIPAEW